MSDNISKFLSVFTDEMRQEMDMDICNVLSQLMELLNADLDSAKEVMVHAVRQIQGSDIEDFDTITRDLLTAEYIQGEYDDEDSEDFDDFDE